MTDVPAYSNKTGISYLNFDALVAAEANGFVVVGLIDNGRHSWPWVLGPFDSKQSAQRAGRRARARFNRDDQAAGFTASWFVRPAWKEDG